MPTTDQLIHQHARLGLVSRPRLLSLGISDEQIYGRLERGTLRLIHPGVYATFGTPLDYRARTLAACLAAGSGAVASHRAALSMWGLLEGEQPIVLTAPRLSHPLPAGIVVHRPNVLRAVDVTTKLHVPITNPIRSLLDAGVELPRWQAGDCVERALVARLVTVKALRVTLAELGGRGRTGTAALRTHLDRRALGDRRPESMIEPVMARLLYATDLGIGPIEYQPALVLDGVELRPDFLVSLAMAVVEIDGLDAHASRAALDHDWLARTCSCATAISCCATPPPTCAALPPLCGRSSTRAARGSAPLPNDLRHDSAVTGQDSPSLNRIVPVLPVGDLAAALAHYGRLGFEMQSYDDTYAFAARDGVQLHLALVADLDPATSTVAAYLYVDDADALHAQWQQAGIDGRLHPPQDTAYGLREGAHVDPDGNLLRFGSPLNPG